MASRKLADRLRVLVLSLENQSAKIMRAPITGSKFQFTAKLHVRRGQPARIQVIHTEVMVDTRNVRRKACRCLKLCQGLGTSSHGRQSHAVA